jgi:hypothetical protein
MRRAAVGWGDSQDGGDIDLWVQEEENKLVVRTAYSHGGAARVKPNLRHGEFLLPPGSTLDESLFFLISASTFCRGIASDSAWHQLRFRFI